MNVAQWAFYCLVFTGFCGIGFSALLYHDRRRYGHKMKVAHIPAALGFSLIVLAFLMIGLSDYLGG